MNDRVEYWIDLAEYDLETARVMLRSERYLYVGFMCHQTIEKALKAVIARDCAEGEIPPKIRNLFKLTGKSGLYNRMSEEQLGFIDSINPLNIEARYPEYKEEIAETLSKAICEKIIKETEELLCWIKEQL